jgi:hypothetical protein
VVSVTALRDVQDDIIGYLLIGTDNTARKQVEEERTKLDREKQRLLSELEQSAERSRVLIDGVRDYALFTMDPEGRVSSWNAVQSGSRGTRRRKSSVSTSPSSTRRATWRPAVPNKTSNAQRIRVGPRTKGVAFARMVLHFGPV